MLSNTIIQNTIEALSSVTRTEYIVYDDCGHVIVTTTDGERLKEEDIITFCESEAESQVVGDRHLFKIEDDAECKYVLEASGNLEDPNIMGKVAVVQLQGLAQAYKEKLDKTSFYQNLILDNMLLVDIHNRAQKLHIDNDIRRIVYIIETKSDHDGMAMEVLKSLYLPQSGNQILSVDEQNIILIKDIDKKASRENICDIAEAILDTLNTEAMLKVRVSYGLPVNELKDISKSYKEAKMALDVGSIFYSSKAILSYENLGIGRLIYQLPVSLCELFVKEVFGDTLPENIDEETLMTVNKFFENNLNVSETSRQLFIHRNTLVYRMEKLQKEIGLDMRVFEDALTFKIAMMVVDYVNYLHKLQK
ncbi:MAG: helix-turn-helix domain-containing protein [Lachnospiraceae bacterium]|nr:helix-turn-helix domain-containing protein [Candidatus Colinaster scatohippi]